ncbi:MAG TPA: ABC transporter permease [Alphaproteobacteria bacterium]|nr:ABC transporter permease [Alphaproteobacteria bacterium]
MMSRWNRSQLVVEGSSTTSIAAGLKGLRAGIRGAPIFSLMVLTTAVVVAIFASLIAPADPIQTNRAQILMPPSFFSHPLGTDHLGRDILSRMIYGARISVTVGFLAVFVSGAVGAMIALVSGVLRGWVDVALMRITDAFLALPYLVVAITVVAILGSSLTNVILVIGLLRWMTYARTIRGEVLRLVEMDFVRLARVAGISRFRLIRRHIFPNIVNTLLVLGTLEVGSAVITEASLSFLGLGVPRPLPSWGTMLAESQTYVFTAWWLPVFPGIAITFLVMASNLSGDWLRDRFDPTRRQL